MTFIIYPPSRCSYLYHFRRIIIKNSYRALNTFWNCSGNCWVGRFCWKPRWFLNRPGVIPDAKGEEHTEFPPFGKDQHEDMNNAYFTHHELHEPELAIVPGWGSISMYPSRYVSILLSLSLSLYIYNGFLPHFPFTACTCSYFCNKHTVDEVYCNEIHLICKDTSTYAKESRGKFFHPNKNPISGSESKKKGCTAQCLILPIHRHPLTWAGWTRLEAWSPLDPWQWHRW